MTERLQNHPLPMEDAVQAYRLFGDGAQQATMDINTHQTTQLASWLGRYFINGTLPPNLERFGYQLIGARLMANEHGASALVLYQTASGTRVGGTSARKPCGWKGSRGQPGGAILERSPL